MPVSRAPGRRVQKGYLELMGVGPIWVEKCKDAMRKFFLYLRRHKIRIPRSRNELDEQVAEYVNFLYQDDRPLDWAASFLGVLKRLCPTDKRDLDLAQLWFSN